MIMIYYKELAHMFMGTEKSQELQPAPGDPGKPMVEFQPGSETMESLTRMPTV